MMILHIAIEGLVIDLVVLVIIVAAMHRWWQYSGLFLLHVVLFKRAATELSAICAGTTQPLVVLSVQPGQQSTCVYVAQPGSLCLSISHQTTVLLPGNSPLGYLP